jgi:hypothetical protein
MTCQTCYKSKISKNSIISKISKKSNIIESYLMPIVSDTIVTVYTNLTLYTNLTFITFLIN